MIHIKNQREIEIMTVGGKILSEVLFEVLQNIKVGVSEIELDQLAEKLIRKKGAEPGFKKVAGYNHTICVSTNDVVVHGIPTERKLKEGDIIGIDCGVYYKGYHTDMAESLRVSTKNEKLPSASLGAGKTKNLDKIDIFLNTGRKALFEGIKQAKPGNRVGDISGAIQSVIEGAGYSVVRSLVGHGVGRQLHEEPEVPGYLDKQIKISPTLESGMTLAIEAIYNMGKPDVVYKGNDNWTIATSDGSLSGLFERTIVVTNDGAKLLTALRQEVV